MKFPGAEEVTADAPAQTQVPPPAAGAPSGIDVGTVEYAAIPVFLFAAVAVGFAAALPIIGGFFGPKRSDQVKNMPYESGMDPVHDTRRRFDVRFHLVAIAFLVFDVELLFLYPWAVALKRDPPESGKAALAVAQSTEPAPQPLPDDPRPLVEQPKFHARGLDAAAASGAVRIGAYERGDGHVEARAGGRLLAFGGAMVFIAMLTVGLIYDWKKGVFQWR